MTKHSPAPWTLELDKHANFNDILDKNGEMIASVWSVLDKPYDMKNGTHDEYIPHANAHCITAAPDMLAALKQLYKEISGHDMCLPEHGIDKFDGVYEGTDEGIDGGDAFLITSWAKTIKDAINKAEGHKL